MLFNSLEFLIFFPIVMLGYFIIPAKLKHLWLLLASYYFYMCWNAKYALLILGVTVATYISGLLLEKVKGLDKSEEDRKKLKNLVVALSFILNIGLLCYFKYTNFFLEIFASAMNKIGVGLSVPVLDIVLPVGISFYTLQALSYTMDVYRDEIYAEKNFIKYALFVSFFPQLVAGPIERSKNLLRELDKPKKFNFEAAREGLFLMLWGFFLKIILADRISIFVDTVYSDYENYSGVFIIFATALFAIQVYCDFAGYSTIAIGASKMIGVQLMDNFDAPFLSKHVSELWRRWHISMTSWFRDYLYFPLGGSRKGKLRKYINIMIIFIVSGLWHGANMTYVLWGGLNGFYQVMGEILAKPRKKLRTILGINDNTFTYKLMSVIVTCALFDFAAVFFRAPSFSIAINMIKSAFTTHNYWVLFDGSMYNCGLDIRNFWLLMICLGILLFSDICKYKGIKIREFVIKQDYWFRWLFIAVSIAALLTFGIWGATYDANSFVYFQF